MFRPTNIPYGLLCMSVYALSLVIIYQNAYEISKRMVLQNETSLLVIAHPDDEAMFFGPTILRKLDKKNSEQSDFNAGENPRDRFYLLCITRGNQDGMGKLRIEELIKSALKLGIKASNVKVLDDIRWLDGENHVWHKQSLQKLIINEILTKNITEVITFDEYGVSGHSNHKTIYQVVRSIKSKIKYIRYYALKSINLIQKYMSFFDFPIFNLHFNNEPNQFYLIDFPEYFVLRDAFYSHESQLVWFRKLYMIFSKYMFINVISELE